MDFQTPRDLTDMLEEFADVVLREKPDDMVDFAAEYFAKVKADRNSYPKAKRKGVGFQAANCEDEPVPATSILKAKSRARNSLPAKFILMKSDIEENEFGVFAKTKIPLGSWFGPYDGQRIPVQEITKEMDTSYMWEILEDKELKSVIDGKDENFSSWMRYINLARNETEQNLNAFQHNDSVYYRSSKVVGPNTELLVWYGKDFLNELGSCIVDTNDSIPIERPEKLIRFILESADISREPGDNISHYSVNADALPVARVIVEDCLKALNFKSLLSDKVKAEIPLPHARFARKGKKERPCTSHSIKRSRLNKNRKQKTYPNTKAIKIRLPVNKKMKANKTLASFGDREMEHHLSINITTEPSAERPHECNQCCTKFRVSQSFNAHMRGHTSHHPFICQDCGKRYCGISSLNTHCYKQNDSKKCHECGQCDAEFNFHTRGKPFTCNHCEKTVPRLSDLKLHERIHAAERPFECTDCEKRFVSSGELRKHQQSHASDRPYQCKDCGKAFSTNRSLSSHRLIHTGEKDQVCYHCGKKFLRSSDLVVHSKIHSDDRPFKCDQCNSSFKRTYALKQHKRGHAGIKPYKCDQCEKAFLYSGDLAKHNIVHSGLKPFSCDKCVKKFSAKVSLKRHMMIHSGEKPFECPFCKNKFRRKHHLNNHIKCCHSNMQT